MIKKLLENNGIKVLIENFIALFSLQAVGYIFPLITFPYLTLHLGVEGFGKYVLVQTIFIYLDLIVSYGFRITATDLISKSNKNSEEVSKIFCAVMGAKVILILLVTLFLFISMLFVPFLNNNSTLIICGLPYLIGNFLFPVWLFQGLQRMKYITYIHIVSKVLFTCLIFVFVKDANDIEYAIGSYSFGFLIAGIISVIIAFKKFSLKIHFPGFSSIKHQFVNGYYIFLSQFSVGMYSSVNILILGGLTSELSVGIYAIANKVYTIVTALGTPFSRALFPFMSNKFNSNPDRYKAIAIKVTIPFFALFCIVGGVIFFGADLIINLLVDSKEHSNQSSLVLKILSIGIPFFPFGAFFTYLLVIQNQKKQLFKIVMTIVALNLLIIFPMIKYFDVVGIAITTVIVAILVAVLKGKSALRFLSKTVNA